MENFTAYEITLKGGVEFIALGYEGNTYLKHLTVDEAAPSTFKLNGEGDDVTVDGPETIKYNHDFKVVCHDSVFVKDNLGNEYYLLLKPQYEVYEKDANGIPTLVGKQPSGRFGKG